MNLRTAKSRPSDRAAPSVLGTGTRIQVNARKGNHSNQSAKQVSHTRRTRATGAARERKTRPVSWRMVKEVRDRRMAKPREWTPGEFVVMFLMADTCQGDSRQASISMGELETLVGKERTAIWRSIRSLRRKGALTRITTGNQYSGASVYDVLPSGGCADATSDDGACCADATPNGGEHVAFDAEHVAFEGGACCTGATLPETRVNNPDRKPMFASLTSAKEKHSDGSMAAVRASRDLRASRRSSAVLGRQRPDRG